jgi:predicted DCC family thiol-disulfide oxidoreductase YuxK
MPGRHLVLYDGVCGLCNGIVQFVLPRDTARVFDFASLQSETGRAWLSRFGRPADRLDTLVVVTDYAGSSPRMLTSAAAALLVARALRFPWRAFAIVGVLPSALLDVFYDAVARRRYRLFGRYDTCRLPPPEQKERFIDV